MSAVKKCFSYNVGDCKLSMKKNGCKLYHPEECCQLFNCIYRDCPKRHPRTCKFGETCIFLNVHINISPALARSAGLAMWREPQRGLLGQIRDKLTLRLQDMAGSKHTYRDTQPALNG